MNPSFRPNYSDTTNKPTATLQLLWRALKFNRIQQKRMLWRHWHPVAFNYLLWKHKWTTKRKYRDSNAIVMFQSSKFVVWNKGDLYLGVPLVCKHLVVLCQNYCWSLKVLFVCCCNYIDAQRRLKNKISRWWVHYLGFYNFIAFGILIC